MAPAFRPVEPVRRVRCSSGLVALLAAALAATAVAQQPSTVAIVGGTVHPVSGPPIEKATVLIRDGLIEAIGPDVAVPAGAEQIDAAGRWVTPGFFNVVSVVGLVEVPLGGGATDDRAIGSNNIAAAFRPWDAFDTATPLIAAARNDGITTIGLMPAGNLVSGQHALVDLAAGRIDTMLRRAPSAMVARVQQAGAAGTASRGELFGKLRILLEEARDWPALRDAVFENRSRPLSARPADFEALQPVMAGTLPLLVVADRVAEIDAVLRLRADFPAIQVILASASEAWQRAPDLAAAGVPVIVGGIRNIPDSFDRLNTRGDNAALLQQAGVRVVLESDSYGDGSHFNVRNVRFEAGNAVANGMTWEAALRAVTIVPAEVFGVGDRVGTLQPGLDANVVVWSGDPFEFATRAEAVFIRGVRVDAPSRQDELMERYRTLPARP
jgi:imidazolonepropionase-like amidohydrolase